MSLDGNLIPRLERLLRGGALVASLAAVITFGCVALLRIDHPFGLEWMEGGAIHSIERVLGAGPLYAEPTPEYVPFIYPPLYFYVSAALAALTGAGFLPLRLVSLAAALGCLAALFALVRRETGSRTWALVSAGLFAATYELSGSWFDLARVDTLFVFLTILSVALLRRGPSLGMQVAAGVCLSLACLTKQSALFFAVPLCVEALLFHRLRARGLLLTTVGTLVLSVVALEWLYDGWLLYYQWLPAAHAVVGPAWITFWTRDLLLALPVALGLAVWWLWPRRGAAREPLAFYAILLASALALCWLSRLHMGGYANVLMPLHAVLALLAALGGSRAVQAARGRDSVLGETAVWAAVLIQFVMLAYDPRSMLPTAADREAGERLVQQLSTIEGDLLVPFHAYLARRAGGGDWMLGNVGGDVLRAPSHEVGERYAESLRTLIRERRFAAIVIDGTAIDHWSAFVPTVGEDLERAYEIGGRAFERDDVFWPVTGARTRPEYVLIPRAGDRGR